MKRLTGFLALFLFASLPLYAADVNDLTYTTTAGEVTITDCYTSAFGDLAIPETIGGNPVTCIGPFAFANCASLTSITIGNSVTSIRRNAFSNCASLTDITIPDGVSSIGRSAFSVCTSLTDITIPASVTSLGDFAFYRSFSLASITFRGAAPSVGENTFNSAGAGATAYVYQQFANSFGGFGSTWQRLPVEAVTNSTIETTIIGGGTIEGDGRLLTAQLSPLPRLLMMVRCLSHGREALPVPRIL